MSLFPSPTSLPHNLAPRAFPGITPESTKAMQDALTDNLNRWHAYFDVRGFHNHISHHVLALWALGSSAARITEAYQTDSTWQRPVDLGKDHSELPVITEENFLEHLGQPEAYLSYLKFFTPVVEKLGPLPAIEKYIFSQEYNFPAEKANDVQPRMLDRFMSAVIHPMIFVGYGVEMGLPGVVIEGLAHTAVHQTETLGSSPPMFHPFKPVPGKAIHAFTVISRILGDQSFKIKNPGQMSLKVATDYHSKYGQIIKGMMDEWVAGVDINSQDIDRVLAEKTEEVIWANALLYGVGGLNGGKEFKADFFTMHLVTSSIFLPSFLATLKPLSQLNLLRTYFTVALTWYIIRGRPTIDIPAFYKMTSATPSDPLICTSDKPSANPWVPITEASITHPDDHLIKLQRSLAHFATLFGTQSFKGQESELKLKGVDELDGTVFIRIAELSAVRLEKLRPRDGPLDQGAQWDRSGFFEE